MRHPRTAIRAYAWDMLKDALDVGGRVFLNRPNAVWLTELPAAVVYFSSETSDIIEGDRYIPQMYLRALDLVVDVLVDQPNDPEKLLRVEDRLDFLARQAEREFANDVFFQKRLDGYTGDSDDPGLLAGCALTSTRPDNVELKNDRVLACQSLTFQILYNDEAFIEEKSSIIESYLMQINRYDYDDDTVDPTLIEAEGDFE